MDELLRSISIWALPVLMAITLHEAAHAWAAWKLGDDTAYKLGRVTLNPISHIDPIGTIVVPLLLAISQSGFMFGWAKPVPLYPHRLNNTRRDFSLVALAGPFSNLLQAFLWLGVLAVLLQDAGAETAESFTFQVARAGLQINIILFVLNMLPLPGLDGSQAIRPHVNPSIGVWMDRMLPYSLIIFVVLIVTGVLGAILIPLVNGIYLGMVSLLF